MFEQIIDIFEFCGKCNVFHTFTINYTRNFASFTQGHSFLGTSCFTLCCFEYTFHVLNYSGLNEQITYRFIIMNTPDCFTKKLCQR